MRPPQHKKHNQPLPVITAALHQYEYIDEASADLHVAISMEDKQAHQKRYIAMQMSVGALLFSETGGIPDSQSNP